MNYDEFIKLFDDAKKRAKSRAWACIICIPIWIFAVSYNGIQKADIVWEVILVVLALFYIERYNKYSVSLKRTKRLSMGLGFNIDIDEDTKYTTGTGQNIIVHRKEDCVGKYCVIHNPSNHNMKDWPTNWRFDRQIMERICECGVGHPDPDDLVFKKDMAEKFGRDEYDKGIHGCCGCCMKEEIKEVVGGSVRDIILENMKKNEED
jgi:hypothetical protein